MLKKSVHFFVSILLFQSLCHADRGQLQHVNNQYMELMLGTQGILHQKATPEQINQMVDGCITAGIIDRLYQFGDKSAQFKEQFLKFEGYRKLDVQLAYAFYMLGYANWNAGNIQTNLQQINTDQNFQDKFYEISAQVFGTSKGSIIEYRNRLEDVIKRTSKPLKFDDFVEVKEVPIPAPGTSTPLTATSGSSLASSIKLKSDFKKSRAYEKFASLGLQSEEIDELLEDLVLNHTEGGNISSTSSLSSLSSWSDASGANLGNKPERYYTQNEIDAIGMPHAGIYQRNKQREIVQKN